MSPTLRQQVLRKIPSVDEILSREEILDLLRVHPRAVVVEAVRRGLGRLREEILNRDDLAGGEETLLSFENIFPLFQREIDSQVQPRLRRVINATGIVIHTNLGRAPLHPLAINHLVEVA
ncbi:MAG: L-seryl-tRNA(Sec) selenium transferase, partial [Deltaproteobacteria bacterium]|nr:L-seryl-tRNA(Sec) selenium transferase [Deltaproteobacteria bacterium]